MEPRSKEFQLAKLIFSFWAVDEQSRNQLSLRFENLSKRAYSMVLDLYARLPYD